MDIIIKQLITFLKLFMGSEIEKLYFCFSNVGFAFLKLYFFC